MYKSIRVIFFLENIYMYVCKYEKGLNTHFEN